MLLFVNFFSVMPQIGNTNATGDATPSWTQWRDSTVRRYGNGIWYIMAILHAAALENETDNKLHLHYNKLVSLQLFSLRDGEREVVAYLGNGQWAMGVAAASLSWPSLPLSAAKSFLIMKNVRNICSK